MRSIKPPLEEYEWISPGLARRLLSINESTLRLWADNGLIRSFRTPGGHRRVSRGDIHQLISGDSQFGKTPNGKVDESILLRIRKKLDLPSSGYQDWRLEFQKTGQEKMRILGRELLTLCLEGLKGTPQKNLRVSAHNLGIEYGTQSSSDGVLLPDAVNAFAFFHTALVEAMEPHLLRQCKSPQDVNRCWRLLNNVTDEVLSGMIGVYKHLDSI